MSNEPAEVERELLARAREGDAAAQRWIVEKYQDQVYYLALGLLGQAADAEDAMQDVMLKALQSLDRFRGDSGLGTWLYRITVNRCRDQQRRRRRRWLPLAALAGEAAESDPAPHVDPVSTAAAEQLQGDLLPALDALSDAERRVFVLRQFQDLNVRETGAVLGLADGTVKALLYRAVRKLRTRLAPHWVEETPS